MIDPVNSKAANGVIRSGLKLSPLAGARCRPLTEAADGRPAGPLQVVDGKWILCQNIGLRFKKAKLLPSGSAPKWFRCVDDGPKTDRLVAPGWSGWQAVQVGNITK
jgi:hypothetical protein